MTGRIQIVLFTTLDLVAQAPGAPDEDPAGGFPFGGWQAPLLDDAVGQNIGSGIADLDALVLGRKTYDIFAAFWPTHTGPDREIADVFNRIPKYVASRGTPQLDWTGTTQLGADLAAELDALRARHENIQVIGSVAFVQTLLKDKLFDELALWVYPIMLGQGKKVFPDGAVPANLELLAPPIVSEKGAVLLRYGPLPGVPATGDMAADDRGA